MIQKTDIFKPLLKRALLTLNLVVVSLCVFAQTALVPDTAFRVFLSKTYPATIDLNNKLVISEAAKVGPVINGSGIAIKNLEGIQYFTNALTINFSKSGIRFVPDLTNLRKLEVLNLSGNQLTTLPFLSALGRLQILNVSENKLVRLPDLSSNDSLIELNVNTNLLDSIPDLSKLIRLERLYVFKNNLKKIPGLENLATLRDVGCYFNELENFPPLNKLVNIRFFNAAHNHLTVPPFFSLSSPILLLDVSNNLITTLPDYSSYTSMTTLNVWLNKLTFKELLKTTTVVNYSKTVLYMPQKPLMVGRKITLAEGSPFTFQTGIDTGIANVTYTWYKNGVRDTAVLKDKWTLLYVQLKDSGSYMAQLSHPAFPGLLLQTDTFHLAIQPCIDFSTISTITSEINCLNTGTLKVLTSSGNPVSVFRIKGKTTGKTYVSANGNFEGLTEPSYILTLETNYGCGKNYSKEVQIPFTKCDDYVITPDNDGHADSFFFEARGKVDIFDKRGNLVKRMNIPGEWDCFAENGKVARGYYMANINDGEVQIGLTVAY